MGCFPSRPLRRRRTTPTYSEPEYDLVPIPIYQDELPPYHASYQLHPNQIQSRQNGVPRRDAPEMDVEALTAKLEALAEERDIERLGGELTRREGNERAGASR